MKNNNFLIDKEWGEKYEKKVAQALGIKWIEKRGFDYGIDIEGRGYTIDVKAYKRPLKIKEFKGVYIETLSRATGGPGWYNDPRMKNNAFVFCVNCSLNPEEIKYERFYLIKRTELEKAIKEAQKKGDTIHKVYDTTEGFILPYEYIKRRASMVRVTKYGGERNEEELQYLERD